MIPVLWKGKKRLFLLALLLWIWAATSMSWAQSRPTFIDLGLSAHFYDEGQVPSEWRLRKRFFGPTKGGSAKWVTENGVRVIKLHSKAALTFLEKTVNIDIREYPIVTWRWKVENILKGIDERTKEGDDHPIRIFFVFEPDPSEQSWWFRMKRSL